MRSSERRERKAKTLTGSSMRVLVVGVVILVSVTTALVSSKVALADIARRTSAARVRIESLSEERSRLTAAAVMKSKPGTIMRIAQKRLGMIKATDREREESNLKRTRGTGG